MTDVLALIVWIALLALAVACVRRGKYPRAKAFPAAMLLGLLVFLGGSAIFSGLLVALGRGDALDRAGWASAFPVLVFVPAFRFARWTIKRPPGERPAPRCFGPA